MNTIDFSDSNYADYLAGKARVVRVDGLPWVVSGGILSPVVMPHERPQFHREEVRRAMRNTGAWLAIWTDSWDTDPCDWWATCCDDPNYDLQNIQRKSRRQALARGMNRCDIEQVDLRRLAEIGYEAYCAALERYGSRGVTKQEFSDGMLRRLDYPGFEAWGSFFAGKLVAYWVCVIRANAVEIVETKSDPAYHNQNPNEALGYEITCHYLRKCGFRYVMAGWPALTLRTQVRDFMESMGYRRIYAPLRVELGSVAKLAMALRADRWCALTGMGLIVSDKCRQLRSLGKLVTIAKGCAHV